MINKRESSIKKKKKNINKIRFFAGVDHIFEVKTQKRNKKSMLVIGQMSSIVNISI